MNARRTIGDRFGRAAAVALVAAVGLIAGHGWGGTRQFGLGLLGFLVGTVVTGQRTD